MRAMEEHCGWKLAPNGRRFGAWALDGFIAAILYGVILLGSFLILSLMHPEWSAADAPPDTGNAVLVWVSILAFVVFAGGYYALGEGVLGRTAGKAVFGLHVVDRRGQAP